MELLPLHQPLLRQEMLPLSLLVLARARGQEGLEGLERGGGARGLRCRARVPQAAVVLEHHKQGGAS